MDEFGEVKARLTPRVYGAATVQLDKLQLGLHGAESGLQAVRSVAPGVLAGAMIDNGSTELRVTEVMSAGWGVSFDQVLAAALSNASKVKPQVDPVNDGIVLVRDSPGYNACLWVWPSLAEKLVEGPLVAVSPMRGYMLLGPDTPDTLTVFAGVMGDLLQEGQDLETVTVSRRTSSGWEAVRWPGSGVPNRLVAPMTRLFMDRLYARQKALLEQSYEKSGEDVFVATHKVWRAPDGRVLSRATWAEGAATLLPVVDEVSLAWDDFSRVDVPWARLTELVPDLLQPCGWLPERMRTSGFPSRSLFG